MVDEDSSRLATEGVPARKTKRFLNGMPMHLRRRRNVSSDFGNLTWMVAASTAHRSAKLRGNLIYHSQPGKCPHRAAETSHIPGLEGFLFSARGHVSKQVKVFEAGDSALISSSSGAVDDHTPRIPTSCRVLLEVSGTSPQRYCISGSTPERSQNHQKPL